MGISVSLEKSTRFLYGIVWSWHEDSCAMLTFIHDGRGTSTYVHPYLRDERSSSITATKHNLFFFTGDLGEFLDLDHFMIASVRCYTPVIVPRYPINSCNGKRLESVKRWLPLKHLFSHLRSTTLPSD
ncbi:uncharacterized protein LOC124193063 [Daphnia pulex]|uniref:uncharacterized protein LOC124193063 n=1 Tax=Daphnia pulex TaxID=6669 RepID=UPI001EDCFDB1|nr:uncharacterized protein LOC124193063 [Daphnia pulex]